MNYGSSQKCADCILPSGMDLRLPGSGTGYCGLDTKRHPNCSSTRCLIPWLFLQIWRGSESSGRWLFEESDHCGTFFMLYLLESSFLPSLSFLLTMMLVAFSTHPQHLDILPYYRPRNNGTKSQAL